MLRVAASGCLLLVVACNKPGDTKPAHSNEPRTRATVVTIQTTLQPAKKIYTHTLVVANDRVRSGDEVDEWRLFDFAQKRVTFVDDLSKTYRIVPFAEALTAHRAEVARPLPEGAPRAQFVVTGAVKTLQGVASKQSVIHVGAYHRELWIGSHPLLPQGLFAMLAATDNGSPALAGVMRSADEAILAIKGFPLVDHSELPYENKTIVVDHTVVKIEQRDVPSSWLNVPPGYKQAVAAPTAPAAHPPPAS